MSPSEEQLRAALQDGQDTHIDTDSIIQRAHAVRRERRTQYGALAAVVVAVAGVGIVAGVVSGGGGSHNAASRTMDAAKGGAAPGANSSATIGPLCPATLPDVASPGTAINTSARGASLFDGSVSAIKLCVYPAAGGDQLTAPDGQPVEQLLTGAAATNLGAGIDAAPTTQQAVPCPLYRTLESKALVIIGARADGTSMTPIIAPVLQNPCNQAITNGSAVRYSWSPPQSLTPLLGRAAEANTVQSPVSTNTHT